MNFRKTLFAGLAACVLIAGGAAFAQFVTPATVTNGNDLDLIQDNPSGNTASTNTYITGKVLRSYIFGSNSLHTGVPVLTTCITSGGTIVGTDYAFILTGGSSNATSCVATFAVAWNSTPICNVTSQTAPGTSTPSYTVSKTAITITQASGNGNIYNATCVAQAGG